MLPAPSLLLLLLLLAQQWVLGCSTLLCDLSGVRSKAAPATFVDTTDAVAILLGDVVPLHAMPHVLGR